jgi:hypothetical protein
MLMTAVSVCAGATICLEAFMLYPRAGPVMPALRKTLILLPLSVLRLSREGRASTNLLVLLVLTVLVAAGVVWPPAELNGWVASMSVPAPPAPRGSRIQRQDGVVAASVLCQKRETTMHDGRILDGFSLNEARSSHQVRIIMPSMHAFEGHVLHKCCTGHMRHART